MTAGPNVSATYPLGYFREDYQYTAPTQPEFLDEHNGRFCVTPEYPLGTYAYFCTVDANWNSAYPYAVGPTFYGVKSAAKVTSITESVLPYVSPNLAIGESSLRQMNINIFPNPAGELMAIQATTTVTEEVTIEMLDINGRRVDHTKLYPGSTIAYFDTRTLYSGIYTLRFSTPDGSTMSKTVTIQQ